MGWRVANVCAERKLGSAARKQIIMFLPPCSARCTPE